MSYPGALPPPPGVIPDLNQPGHGLQKVWIAALSLELGFPVLLFIARVYVRRVITRDWSWADAFISLAFLLFISEIAIGLSLINDGVGKHAWNIPLEVYSKFAENLNIQQVIYMPAMLFTKMAILFQLLDIFVPSRSGSRWRLVWSFIILNFVFFTLLFFLELFQCNPRKKIWNPTVPGTCIDIQKTFIATGSINVLEDFGILAMSLYWVAKLQTSVTKRLKIASIFAVGVFVLRLAESVLSMNDADITVALVPVSLWATGEISSGIVVACMPFMPKLFHRPGARTMVEASKDETKFMSQRSKGLGSIGTSTLAPVLGPKHRMESDASEYSSSEDTCSQDAEVGGHIVRTFEVDQYSTPRSAV